MKEEYVEKVIWETENFVAVAVGKPFVSREEGGHLIIKGNKDKYRYNSRLDFSPQEVLEQQRLSQMISVAYKKAMKIQNIDIIRLNFFEAGNWAWKTDVNGNTSKPFYHEHIFGRTVDAKYQKFPDAPYLPDKKTGFYDNFVPLTSEDIDLIISEMKKLENEEKFLHTKWKLDK